MNQLEILLIFSIVFKYCHSTAIYYYVPSSIKNITLPCEVDENEVKECYWTHDGKSVSDQDCDIVLSNITSKVHDGSWTCSSVSYLGHFGQTQDYSVRVIEAPILNFKVDQIQNDSIFDSRKTYSITCETQKYSQQMSKLEVKVTDNQENIRSLLKQESDSTKYIYQPQIEDAHIECQILIGDLEKKNPYGYYEEISKIFVTDILFEPILSNFTEDGIVSYCSNPIPTNFIIFSPLEQEVYLKPKLISKNCFEIEIPEEFLSGVNLTLFRINSDNESNFNMVLDAKRLEDLNIILTILVPFTLMVISIAGFLLLFISYKKKWWCFHTNNYQNKTNSTILSEDSCPPSPSLVSHSKSFQEHLYEVVHQQSPENSGSRENSVAIYDTLDFQRPLNRLEGHYQSSKTLRTFSSQEDYLCPISYSSGSKK